jgi:hypothetical protein
MTVDCPPHSRLRDIVGRVASHQLVLWTAFVLVHLVLGLINLVDRHLPMGDVTLVYRFWVEQAITADYLVGIDTSWVYPIVAFVPMLFAYAFGPELYASTWLSIVLLLDVVAFGFLTGWGSARERVAVAWWWIAFLAALGPIALGRIDSITVPLAIVGVLLLASRPRTAAVVLAIATWIKVWPAALIAAIVIASRARGIVVGAGIATSAVIVALALAFGSGSRVLSFITEQTGRGLQVESPVSTIWLWQAAVGVPDTFVYYDSDILTFQVAGSGVDAAAEAMTPIMAVAALAVAAIGLVAARRRTPTSELLPVLALALVTVLIACNKVGSPQFAMWLSVPVILGLVTNAAGRGISFRVPAVLVLVIAALTHVVYPYLYHLLLGLAPGMLLVLTARNLALFVLLGWVVAVLVRLAREGSPSDERERPSA